MPRAEDGCPATGMVEIRLGTDLQQGKNYSLSFSYQGAFSPSQGLYRSDSFKYTQVGIPMESVLLVTQLEETGARHLLPCLDEPKEKASPFSDPRSQLPAFFQCPCINFIIVDIPSNELVSPLSPPPS